MQRQSRLTRTEILLGRILLQLAQVQSPAAMLRQLEGLRHSGFSTEQVSVIAGTTPATIAVTLSRARKKTAARAAARAIDVNKGASPDPSRVT